MLKFNQIFVLLIGLSLLNPLQACTTIIVGKKANLEGKTIIARSSDAIDARRAKNLKIYYDKQGAKSYLGLPYWDLEKDENNDMAQVATNAYGVSLSATQTIKSNSKVLALDPAAHSKQGLSEKNIPSLIMPTARSAATAIEILGKAIEERGVENTTGFGVLLADKDEAWYLETLSGHQWVAIKIPEDAYFIAANGPGQIQDYLPKRYEYKLSNYKGKNPIQFAKENGLAKFSENNDFDFRKTFADVLNPNNPKKNFVRLAYLQFHFNPSTRPFNSATINQGIYPMFLKPEKKISLNDLQRLYASHYEEFSEFDPYRRWNKDENLRPYYYPIANPNTSNVHLTLIDKPLADGDRNLSNLVYLALGMPTVSFYLPIYYGLNELPKALTEATNRVDLQKLFWQFRILQVLVFLSDPAKNIDFNPQERMNFIQKSYQKLEKNIEKNRLLLIANYKKTYQNELIDAFTIETVEKISKLNQELIELMMRKLEINSLYHLENEHEKLAWFRAKLREQECNYKPEHCLKNTNKREI